MMNVKVVDNNSHILIVSDIYIISNSDAVDNQYHFV